MSILIVLLLVFALVLSLMACFGVPARPPILPIAVTCLAIVAIIDHGILP